MQMLIIAVIMKQTLLLAIRQGVVFPQHYKKYEKEDDNQFGIIQSKTFGAPVVANRLTEDTNTKPDRIRYFGDPISAMDFNATTIMPSFNQRWRNSAHSYSGLQITGKVPLHDVPKNMLTPSPDDSKAEILTY